MIFSKIILQYKCQGAGSSQGGPSPIMKIRFFASKVILISPQKHHLRAFRLKRTFFIQFSFFDIFNLSVLGSVSSAPRSHLLRFRSRTADSSLTGGMSSLERQCLAITPIKTARSLSDLPLLLIYFRRTLDWKTLSGRHA